MVDNIKILFIKIQVCNRLHTSCGLFKRRKTLVWHSPSSLMHFKMSSVYYTELWLWYILCFLHFPCCGLYKLTFSWVKQNVCYSNIKYIKYSIYKASGLHFTEVFSLDLHSVLKCFFYVAVTWNVLKNSLTFWRIGVLSFCWEYDKKISVTFMSACKIWSYTQQTVSLAKILEARGNSYCSLALYYDDQYPSTSKQLEVLVGVFFFTYGQSQARCFLLLLVFVLS